MNIFNEMAKSIVVGHKGKINIFPNGFEYRDKGTTNAQGVYLKASPDATGRMKSLSLGVRTANGCPQPPPGDFPKNDRGRYWVPMKLCRKCPQHIKRRRGQPYPCCGVLRQLASQGPTPIEQVAGIMKSATDKVAEIMK